MVQLHGFVDTYYALNTNLPADGTNFAPGTGSTGKRFNEFTLNLAALDLVVDKAPVGARLTLAFGNGIEVLHAGEPRGVATGPDVLRNILTAEVSYSPQFIPGLMFEMGKFASPIGFEVMPSKDNWNYTRAWSGEYSPYYLAGLKTSYTFFNKHITVAGLVVNGWQLVGETNLPKSLGTVVAWNSDMLSVSWNTLTGPELGGVDNTFRLQVPGVDTRIRHFQDVVAVVKPSKYIWFALQVDVGYQRADVNTHQFWHTATGSVRLMPVEWLALAFRGEYFLDPSNAITGFQQMLGEGTATLELMPAPFITMKLETRADYSTAPVFSTAKTNEDGSVVGARTQGLLLASAVVYF